MIPGSGRSPGEGNRDPLQYSYLENPMDRGAWWATVCGVAESDWAERVTFPLFGIPSGASLVGKPLPANAGDLRAESSIPGLGRSPGEGNGYSLQSSCLENPTDKGA